MTYAELASKLQGWWESDETDFVAEVDFFIELAEKRIYRSIDLNSGRKETDSVALVQGTAVVDLPSDAITLYNVILVDSAGARTSLIQKDVSFIDDYTGDRTLEGEPRFYAWYDEDSILLGPAPDDATDTLTVSHTYRPTQLSASNTTSWLSLNAPDVLLYACLLEVAIHQKSEADVITGYQGQLQAATQGLLMEENYRNRSEPYRDGEIRMGK